MAMIDATSCWSISLGTGLWRGLSGLRVSERGSTLRSSGIMGSWIDGLAFRIFLRRPLPPAAAMAGRGKGVSRRSRAGAEPRDPFRGGRGAALPVTTGWTAPPTGLALQFALGLTGKCSTGD